MNIKQLIRIIDLNKSIPPVMIGLLIEGVCILISLRIAEKFMSPSEYSELTIVYSLISILSFGLFAGLEQIRQSEKSTEFNIQKTTTYSLFSLIATSPIVVFILIKLELSILFALLIIISGFSYAVQFDLFGYLSYIEKPYNYAALKILDGATKILFVFTLGSYLNTFQSIVYAYSLAPLFSILLFIRLTKVNLSFIKLPTSNIKSYIDLSILNFVSLSYLYGLPLVSYLKDNETIYAASSLFFSQAYSQVLQFTLAPIQFYFLPKIAKQYLNGEDIKLSDIYRGSYLGVLISVSYILFTYLFGVQVITYFFYNSYSLNIQETILIALISILVLLIKTSSFFLIAIRKTELVGYALLFSFAFLLVIVYFTQLNPIFAFLFSCLISLFIIFFLNLKLISDDQ